jgi:hypothetical protein
MHRAGHQNVHAEEFLIPLFLSYRRHARLISIMLVKELEHLASS